MSHESLINRLWYMAILPQSRHAFVGVKRCPWLGMRSQMDIANSVFAISVGRADWAFYARLPVVTQHAVGRNRSTSCRFHSV
jgi:hypothetical protein